MQTYLIWLTRILVCLTIACAAVAAYTYLFSGDAPRAKATLSAASIGLIGFGFTAFFTHIIARNQRNS